SKSLYLSVSNQNCMKWVFFLLLTCVYISGKSQSGKDSIQLLQDFARFLDLEFTGAEADSMLQSISNRKKAFSQAHAIPLPNSVPYPFAFSPYSQQIKIDSQQLNSWNIPDNILLPSRKEDLA